MNFKTMSYDQYRNGTERMAPFILSIEVTEGCAERHGFHLGTQLPLAMQIAQERFHARRRAGLPVLTVALIRDGKLVDVYYGDKWHSELKCDCSPDTPTQVCERYIRQECDPDC